MSALPSSTTRRIFRTCTNATNARASTVAYEQELYKKLSTATLNAELAQKQLQVAQLTESQAQEYFDIVSEQYNVGKASSLERTDAQVSLSDAKAKTVSAIYDYQDALALIANLIGDYPALEREEIYANVWPAL